MNTSRLVRAARWLAATAAIAVLTACGGESVVTDLNPERFLVVGDDLMDVGQNGYLYTINDGQPSWVQDFAAHYGLAVTPANDGGWGFAQGHARVTAADESSGTNAPSVSAQIDAMLARTTLGSGDIVLIGGGQPDIIAAVQQYGISEEATAAVRQAGSELAQQVRRVTDAGATHVAVVGVPLLGDTPWARAQGLEGAVNSLCIAFNTALLLDIHDMGDKVLYLDAALFFDLIFDDADDFGFTNGKDPVCTTPDVSTCTADTVSDENYDRWLFADDLHFTPRALRLFGSDNYSETGYSRFDNRW